MTKTAEIGVLWEEGPLTYLEWLSLTSFVAVGHSVTLFTYVPVSSAPPGVTIVDAATILPAAANTPAPRRDAFRYRLLAAKPGIIWAEPDFIALRPLMPQNGVLAGRESLAEVSPNVLALPADGPTLGLILNSLERPTERPSWLTAEDSAHADAGASVWGARLLTYALDETFEIANALPPSALFAVPFDERIILLARKADLSHLINDETIGVRVYGDHLKKSLLGNGTGLPRYWCWIGAQLRQHGIAPRKALIPGTPDTLPDHLWQEKDTAKAPITKTEAPPASAIEITLAPPQSAPTVITVPAGQKAEPAGRVLIVTTMKNEGPFLLEWIAYHRSIGITDFLVYTNDCDDGTDEFHTLLAQKGIIAEHLENPYRQLKDVKPQQAAYGDAQTRPVAQEANWVICMDVDEFINIHVGDGTFQDMLDAVPDANMISMTWRLFGNGFIRDYKDTFITDRLHWCAHERASRPHQAWGFKTAFRNTGIYRKYGVHRPKGLNEELKDQIRWYDSAGRPMPGNYHNNGWRMSKNNWGYNLVTLNHYSLRSSESYLVKRDRGRVNHVDRDQGLAYWFRMNHNAVQDRSILNKLPAAKAEFAKLMADPDIAAMHVKCVAAHQAKIDELMTRPDYQDLFETVESKRFKNLSRMLHNFGNEIFDQGPVGVPPEFIAHADAMPFDVT